MIIDNLPNRIISPKDAQSRPHGVAFVGTHPLSPYSILGEVLERRRFNVRIEPQKISDQKFATVSVWCSTDADARVYRLLQHTPELDVLETAFANGSIYSSDNLADYSDDRLILPQYEGCLDSDLQRCFWPEETQDKVRAYWWENLSKSFYWNNLRFLDEIKQLEIWQQDPEMSPAIQTQSALSIDRKMQISERLKQAALKSKNKSREILKEKGLQALTSKRIAVLIDEVIDRRLPASASELSCYSLSQP